MKISRFTVAPLALGILASLPLISVARAGVPPMTLTETQNLLAELKDLALRCVVQPVVRTAAGHKEYGPLKSVCSELQETRNGGAIIMIRGEKLRAVLIEADESDGGDLDHLIVTNSKGDVVAQRKNVLAFENVFIALAGGNQNFREVDQD